MHTRCRQVSANDDICNFKQIVMIFIETQEPQSTATATIVIRILGNKDKTVILNCCDNDHFEVLRQ